jgi:hypothetical protein
MTSEFFLRLSLCSAVLMAACARPVPKQPEPGTGGIIFEVVNGSACVARIVLHDVHGNVIEDIRYRELRPGTVGRYRVPNPTFKLDAIPVDALGNSCDMSQQQKITITKIQ